MLSAEGKISLPVSHPECLSMKSNGGRVVRIIFSLSTFKLAGGNIVELVPQA